MTLAFSCPSAHHQQQGHGDIGGSLGENVRSVRDRYPSGPGSLGVDMVEPDAEVGQHPAAQGLRTENFRRYPIGNRTKESVSRAESFLQALSTEGAVVAIEPGIEFLAELFFHDR